MELKFEKPHKEKVAITNDLSFNTPMDFIFARSRYANGLATQLELLDAELVLLRAEVSFAQEKRTRAVSLVALERAVGVLGDGAPDPD